MVVPEENAKKEAKEKQRVENKRTKIIFVFAIK
jgi:hypothetical protein